MKPISKEQKKINDYCEYRMMLSVRDWCASRGYAPVPEVLEYISKYEQENPDAA